MRRAGVTMAACAMAVQPVLAADVSDARKAELEARIGAMGAEEIETMFADLFTANGCELSLVEEQATDRKIMSHFAAALSLTPEEAEAVHDPLQDRIQVVSRDMVRDGLVSADAEAGVVRLQDCTPDLSVAAAYAVPGVGIVQQARFVDLVKGYFAQHGCVVDFSERSGTQADVLETVFAALDLKGDVVTAAMPTVDNAMADVLNMLVTSGEITVNETDMSAALVDCNG